MRYAAVALLLCLGCAGSIFSPSTLIDTEWKIAQDKINCLWGELYDPYDIEPDDFNWQESIGPFDCDDNQWPDNGCFDPNNQTITWNTSTPNVIRHEAGHAILHRLRSPFWSCYEHVEGCGKGKCDAKPGTQNTVLRHRPNRGPLVIRLRHLAW